MIRLDFEPRIMQTKMRSLVFTLTAARCMDYTNNPSTNQHPNSHDYNQLVSIYSHLDNTSTLGQIVNRVQDFVHQAPAEWGKLIRHSGNGKNSLFELDLGNGRKVFTFVIWA